tara:strand:- start:335 stop:487 length:153 start_codon:yes stop_codon:yes gene_type:complete
MWSINYFFRLGSSHQIKKATNKIVIGVPIIMSKNAVLISMEAFKERVKFN